MYSELRIDLNLEVGVVRHDLGLEQDAVRLVSDFGNDLLEPPIDALDQHLAPNLHEKTMFRFDLYSIQEYIATVYIIIKKGALSSLRLKPRAYARAFR